MPRRAATLLAGLLGLLTLTTFHAVTELGFVWDDFHYLHLNPMVRDGFSAAAVRSAFTATHSANWHPLTWVSHMLDVSAFGLAPAGHHGVNLLLHAANAVLLFALLRSFTGALWRPAFVAAAFALHPLRVESVAWVAERKDVLSGCLGLLALLAYGRFARSPARGRAALVAALLLLGLLAKPMLVTLPFLMLLLDWWPLGRAAPRPAPRRLAELAAEKTPLFLLAAAAAAATLYAQGAWGALSGTEATPLAARLANAALAAARYLDLAVRPLALATPYPYPAGVPVREAWLAAGLLAGLSALAYASRRRLPALTAGWLWYLGLLLPVLGIVQVGAQAMADRYTYLPLIGVAVALAWALGALAARTPALRAVTVACALLALAPLPALTGRQLAYWRDELSLFGRAVEVTGDNWVAHHNLGVALLERGRPREAKAHFEESLRIHPGFAPSHRNLGVILAAQGDLPGAAERFRTALALDPADTESRRRLDELPPEGP